MPAACKQPRPARQRETAYPLDLAKQAELGSALQVIAAAAANLRHYRDRLTAEEHMETVRDIEQATAWIANALAVDEPATTQTSGRPR